MEFVIYVTVLKSKINSRFISKNKVEKINAKCNILKLLDFLDCQKKKNS